MKRPGFILIDPIGADKSEPKPISIPLDPILLLLFRVSLFVRFASIFILGGLNPPWLKVIDCGEMLIEEVD